MKNLRILLSIRKRRERTKRISKDLIKRMEDKRRRRSKRRRKKRRGREKITFESILIKYII
jgi:hypothetical protein